MLKPRIVSALTLLVCAASVACGHEVKLEISAGQVARQHSPVRVTLPLPADLAKNGIATIKFADGSSVVGQVTPPRLLAAAGTAGENLVSAELNFLLPTLAAGETIAAVAEIKSGAADAGGSFTWKDTPNQQNDLTLGDRPVLRYMYAPLDESSKDTRHATMKVYHHVFDPTGKRLVTKGPGGLFPHHRGLYFGFNRISYDGKTADTWHCNNGEWQSHEKVLSAAAGSVLGRHVVEVAWHGKQGDVFASEQRELTAYATPSGTLIEFASKLSTTGSKVKLDGDPQHAGFQFRAAQDVPDKTAKETYYLRPDGSRGAKDGKGDTLRNWPGHKEHVNLPWNALSFVIDGVRYTCCYLDRPENPKEARFSERDYGRFGSYFEYELDRDRPLLLNYRIWLQAGELTRDDVQRLDDDFVHPVAVSVK